MKAPKLSFDQARRQLRHGLFMQRQLDRDHSDERLFNDAKKLDAQLVAQGYQLPYVTEWGKNRARSYQQVGIADLILADE